jgi:hypothetical protein
MLDFRDFWRANPDKLANLYTYDGYFALSDRVHQLVRDALFAANRDEPIGRFYPSALDPADPPLSPKAFARPRLVFFKANWERRRIGLFTRLASRPWMEIYGPDGAWGYLGTAAYRGSVPFDGYSVLERYRRAGVGLVLLSDHHLEDDCTTNRIFEICAAGALAIVPHMPWHERIFGDSVLYYRQQAADNVVADAITAHLEWISSHPDEAARMAAKAHDIFAREFALDRLFDNVVRYHADRTATRRAKVALPLATVSVVVRTRDSDPGLLGRCLRSVAAQRGVTVDVVLVPERALALAPLVAEFHLDGLPVISIEQCDGPASKRLWTALRRCGGDFVAILDEQDEWLADHLHSLVETARAQGKGFAHSGTISHDETPRPTRFGTLEHRALGSFPLGPLPRDPLERAAAVPINTVVFRRDLLDARDLVDPDMETGADWYLLLSLLGKEHPAFTFRATVVCRQSSGSSPVRKPGSDDLRRLRLRFLGRPFPAPPPAIDPSTLRERGADENTMDGSAPTGRIGEYGVAIEPLSASEVALTSQQISPAGETRSEHPDRVLPLRVRPPRQMWAYGALLSVPYPADGECVLRIRCRVLCGRAGFGVLTADESDFIERLFVHAQPDDLIVNLSIPSTRHAGRVVVQATDSVDVAEVLVDAIEIATPPDRHAG